jgi:hypothetical protein
MSHELAQLNLATLNAPIDSPQLADFVANLDRINTLAESSPGFIWRLKGEGNDATSLRPVGENVLVNMSVWKDVASLNDFVYRSEHVQIMRRRKEWFERMVGSAVVLWWVPRGHRPSVQEAIAKLEQLNSLGPSPAAFTFRQGFPAPDAARSQPFAFEDECPGT